MNTVKIYHVKFQKVIDSLLFLFAMFFMFMFAFYLLCFFMGGEWEKEQCPNIIVRLQHCKQKQSLPLDIILWDVQ